MLTLPCQWWVLLNRLTTWILQCRLDATPLAPLQSCCKAPELPLTKDLTTTQPHGKDISSGT